MLCISCLGAVLGVCTLVSVDEGFLHIVLYYTAVTYLIFTIVILIKRLGLYLTTLFDVPIKAYYTITPNLWFMQFYITQITTPYFL